jgi:hypothetical protein
VEHDSPKAYQFVKLGNLMSTSTGRSRFAHSLVPVLKNWVDEHGIDGAKKHVAPSVRQIRNEFGEEACRHLSDIICWAFEQIGDPDFRFTADDTEFLRELKTRL